MGCAELCGAMTSKELICAPLSGYIGSLENPQR